MSLLTTFKRWYLTQSDSVSIYADAWAKDHNQVQCFPKRYWDLDTVQARLGFSQEEINYAWAHKKPETVVYLGQKNGNYYFISNYTK